ncbi:MerR family DNA-binding transcriptional regulator [Clostridium tagluense]|uniref:MerR family DNA-binding transcriptional regulator n=1 Tax=Clostridium tagluense TaxID=360422 RepID=UPI001CF22086|nr:MerR family DNA-binding transcriptional regulator [Clostridium tagluense]MCB2311914.1 MerR family DNA-binding transcriptional regulator [Clostridium tagluense]MCB2317333.1 MerR family DNA-binding transcriptional regulator [Clostridium tagluense]MCB2322878.1 MerR family DNA-binding transcriptional regulator [Clostridium tagluense]MCB2326887.1 MerR family DNA-binding transcriptional regulator [Clostridium tagluense]MCB2332516.1 MerR family DNA-binding transcriptional regulator [Clostridium ta
MKYTVGEMVKQLDVDASTLRYYDKEGLLPFNAACIMENMALAATDLGLGNVYIFGGALAIAKNPELCAELKIPEGYIPVSALPVGKATKPLKERELTLFLNGN